MAKSPLQKLIDGGLEWSSVSKKQIDEMSKQLAKAADVRRRDAEQFVQALVDRSRETSEQLNSTVQREVAKQLGWLAERFDELEDQLEAVADRLAEQVEFLPGRAAPPTASAPRATAQAAETSASKKSASRKSASKKSASRKSAAKTSVTTTRSAPKQRAANRSASNKAAAKKTSSPTGATTSAAETAAGGPVGTSGVRKISTTRTPPTGD
jgi:polyhydroxyalkanoate synthesis regulator phasin